jgi:predicted nucleic acid-binding protein
VRQIKLLKEKGILVSKLKNKQNELRKKWEEKFTNTLSKSQKRKIYFHQHLWHVFSYKKLPCLEEELAAEAFGKIKKDICYIFYQDNEDVLLLENARSLKAEDIIHEIDCYIDDVYVMDKDFSWTYIHTHEQFCGPYFFQTIDK